MPVTKQPKALRLADLIDQNLAGAGDVEIAAELRRLHEQNADYANTIDGLIISSCDDAARIVRLENLRDDLLEALKWVVQISDEGGYPDGKCLQEARAAITKATGVDFRKED